MTKKGDDKQHPIDDWMVRISFAEADEADMGFEATGAAIERKTRFAMEKVIVARSERVEVGSDEKKKVSASGSRADEPGREKLQVMILDDEPEVGRRLEPSLTAAGFEVEVFLDPVAALRRLKEKEFDIIVTDFQMDEVDGIQILEYVMDNCKDTRVILITAYGTVAIARKALVKGAFDFLTKPFKPKELRAVVNKAALSLGHIPLKC